MNDVMIDLETMGTAPNAPIVAIGAVMFDPETQTIGDRYYQRVTLQSAVETGAVMDPDTVLWWLKQSDAARAELTNHKGIALNDALCRFSVFVGNNSDSSRLRVWGNGASFDNVLLSEAYRRCGIQRPWNYWNDRCYRTVRALHPWVIEPDRTGTAHKADDDALHQARHLLAIQAGRTRAEETTA